MRKFFLLSAITAIAFVMACANPAAPVNIELANAPAAAQTDDAPRIALADAQKDFDANDAIFIDTRSVEAYRDEHIKGAKSLPAATLEDHLKEVPKDKKIIAYCS